MKTLSTAKFDALVEEYIEEAGTNPNYGGFQTGADQSGGVPVPASQNAPVKTARVTNATQQPKTTTEEEPGNDQNNTNDQLMQALKDPETFKKFQALVNDPNKKVNTPEELLKSLV